MKFYAADVKTDSPQIFGFGNDTIKVTKKYLTQNGMPWLPVMGEFHFSRYKKEDWEEELIKMKNGGIEIISSYVLWIHHEEVEGAFDWTHNNDLRAFISLCQKHSLYFFLRPGPWAHGECRNGGFPDWLLEKCKENVRSNSEDYLFFVKRLFLEIARQLVGLTNIIGIQVENELVDQPDYLLAVKQIILDCGMNAPIFTATAWGYEPTIPKAQFLPIYGGYPEAPWEQHTQKLPPNSHYFFNHERNDSVIGNDLMKSGHPDEKDMDNQGYTTPFLTCEAGGGNQVTYHRRPIIAAKDVSSLAFTLLGSGCNLLGYYMYHGGSNPIGIHSTMQESRETGYLNDYPIVSYDFQSPIGDCGQFRESYPLLAQLHSFTKSFGHLLCGMDCVLPDELPQNLYDNQTLRAAIRTDGTSGFVFINNYQRLQSLPQHEDVQIEIALASEVVNLRGIHVAQNSYFVLPFHLTVGKKLLNYALAQPLSIEDNVWSFLEIEGMEPHFYFEDCDFILTQDGYWVDDIELRLVKAVEYQTSKGEILPAVLSDNQIGFDRFEYLGLVNHTQEFTLKWEQNFAYLKLNCVGNVAHAYYDNKLISDWFCNGTDWVIDVRSLQSKELIIKIQPLLQEDDIYFEVDMPRDIIEVSALGFKNGGMYL